MDGQGNVTTVRLTLTAERRTVDVPAGEVDEVLTHNGKVFALVFRRALAALSLEARLGGRQSQEAAQERLENKPIPADAPPLDFEERPPPRP